MKHCLFFLVVSMVYLILAAAQVETMIPLSKTGYSYVRGNPSSPVTVELYIDLGCSSCLESWPTLTQVYKEYKSRVNFHYKIFPLPYHQQAFILSKGAGVVQHFGSSEEAVFNYFDTVFANQAQIYNSATAGMSYNQVIDLVAGFATAGTGVSQDQYYVGMNSSSSVGNSVEMSAR